jgi:predicted O-methyltransferase YrrM
MRSPKVRSAITSLFGAVQDTAGLSVTPTHFYFPVPSLKSFEKKDWARCRPCAGIDFALEDQIARLHEELLPFAAECNFPEAKNGSPHTFHFNNGFFERVDAEVAYSFVRRNKPKRIVEIGSGNSTLVLGKALLRNGEEGSPGELISIEPHPAPFLKSGVPGLTQLIEKQVQEVPLELFTTLQAKDILFIDSSHVVSMDSDVLHECLRILPELAPGVLVHFHDVFTPLDYPKQFVMKNLCFWGEQYLLEAFLAFSSAYKVVWSSSAMQQFHPEVLKQAFPAWEGSYGRMPSELRNFSPTLNGTEVWPCSFWIVREDDTKKGATT